MATKHFLIFGPPGSGKGTQAKRLVKRFGFKYLGTGDLMRQELEDGKVLGIKIKKILESGKLVDDDTANSLVDEALVDLSKNKNIIFDGYPRTIPQAEHLQNYFENNHNEVYAIFLNVTEENLIERMGTRRICEACKKIFQNPAELKIEKCSECGGKLIKREDDRPEIVKKRLEVYNKETKPLLDFYGKHATIVTVDGNPPIDEVSDEIELKVEAILSS